jgi:hypothetical protein
MSENAFPIAIIIILTCLLCQLRALILRIGKTRYSGNSTKASRQPEPDAPLAVRWASRPWTLAVQARRSGRLRVISGHGGQKRTNS